MINRMSTTDRFEVAYYLTFNFTISEVKFIEAENGYVPEFHVSGKGLGHIAKRYHTDKALANISEFESMLLRLDEIVRNELELFYPHLLEDKDNEEEKQ
jgi:hypothetical protein